MTKYEIVDGPNGTLVIQKVGGVVPPPTPPPAVYRPREWDPQLTEFGVCEYVPATPVPGLPTWRVDTSQWWNEAKSAGKHDFLIDAVDQNNKRVVGQRFIVWWGALAQVQAESADAWWLDDAQVERWLMAHPPLPEPASDPQTGDLLFHAESTDPVAVITAEEKRGEPFSTNFPLWPNADVSFNGGYSIRVLNNPGQSIPSDRVIKAGMGVRLPQPNGHLHTSICLFWKLFA